MQFLVIFIFVICFKKPCLPEENCLDLEKIVTMLANSTHRNRLCPLLESVTIDAKTEVACKRDEEGVFPILVEGFAALHDLSGTFFEAFQSKGSHPIVYEECREVAYHITAWRTTVVMAQLGIILFHICGHFQLQLRNLLTIGIAKGAIYLTRHMENDVVVGGICVVMMSKPVTGLQVQLHIAHPLDAVQLDFRPREVRTCIGVVDARIEHLQKTPVCRS